MRLTLSHVALAAVALVGLVPSVSALPAEVGKRGASHRMRRVHAVPAWRRTKKNETESLTDSATTTSTDELATSTDFVSSTDTLSVDTAFETATSTDFSAATATSTDFQPEATETRVYHGQFPIDQSVFPTINSWDSCNSFLRSNGIDLFPNSFNSIDVFIQQVTVIEILIDDRGRSRRRRTYNYFPPPQDYFQEFDLSIQQNNIIAIDSNGFSSGSFDSNIGFDNGRGNGNGNRKGSKGKSSSGSSGISSSDINDLVNSIIS